MAFAVWLTVLAVPILVIDNLPRHDASAAAAKVTTVVAPTTTVPPTTAPTTTVPAPEVVDPTPPTTAAPPPTTAKPAAAKVAAAPPPTTAKPVVVTTTTTTTTAPRNGQDGEATFYDYKPGECAHRTLPMGTVVTVTNVATGASVTCTVTDRGPYSDPARIIDLDRTDFSRIASPSTGVVSVHISW